ncbi:MAG: hypothetical protein WEE64_07735 [Dehalococcoidia bacterium]
MSGEVLEFTSREEEAEFRDTHSPLDYGEWKELKRLTVTRPLGHIPGVRLDAKTNRSTPEGGTQEGDGRVYPRAHVAAGAPGTREVSRVTRSPAEKVKELV